MPWHGQFSCTWKNLCDLCYQPSWRRAGSVVVAGANDSFEHSFKLAQALLDSAYLPMSPLIAPGMSAGNTTNLALSESANSCSELIYFSPNR